MEQILDVDAGQPPYVELFTHHPLMFMSLGNQRLACKQATPKELLFWSHSVQCKIDDVAAALGLYKIRMLGPCCMFASTPEMPAKQQAGVMFTAAKRLSSMLAEASLPGGDALATQITIHAGKYAGGVVGKGSWTYEVFGSDVQDLLDMDRFCSPNSIQVSDPVLSLLGLETAQFAPSCKLLCSGHEVLLHRWLGQAADGPPGMQAGSAAAAAAARKGVQHDLPVVHLSPDDQRAAMQQQQQQQQQFGPLAPSAYGLSSGSKHAKQQGWLGSEGECSASSAMQPNLQFKDAELEGRYVASQAEQWAHMDGAFVAVTLVLLAAAAYGSSAHGLQQQLLLSLGHWLVPAVAGCWMLLQPRSYCRRREAVWAVHRVLAAAHTAGLIALVMLQQRWQLAGAAAGVAAAGVAAEGLLRMQQSAAGMLRRRALAMLVESLGFKVRFKTHLLTLTLNVAATALGVLWQCWSGAAAPATAAAAGSRVPWLWELLLQLCLGCVAPTVLLYFWEADERAAFVGGSAPGSRRCSVDEPAEYGDARGATMSGKAKAL